MPHPTPPITHRRRSRRSQLTALSDEQRGQLYDTAHQRMTEARAQRTTGGTVGEQLAQQTAKPQQPEKVSADADAIKRSQLVGAIAGQMSARRNRGPAEVNRTGNVRDSLVFHRVNMGGGKELHDYPGTENDVVVKKQRVMSDGSTAGASTTPTYELKRRRRR